MFSFFCCRCVAIAAVQRQSWQGKGRGNEGVPCSSERPRPWDRSVKGKVMIVCDLFFRFECDLFSVWLFFVLSVTFFSVWSFFILSVTFLSVWFFFILSVTFFRVIFLRFDCDLFSVWLSSFWLCPFFVSCVTFLRFGCDFSLCVSFLRLSVTFLHFGCDLVSCEMSSPFLKVIVFILRLTFFKWPVFVLDFSSDISSCSSVIFLPWVWCFLSLFTLNVFLSSRVWPFF